MKTELQQLTEIVDRSCRDNAPLFATTPGLEHVLKALAIHWVETGRACLTVDFSGDFLEWSDSEHFNYILPLKRWRLGISLEQQTPEIVSFLLEQLNLKQL